MNMEMPVSVGSASRGWDEQSLDLRGATTQVRDAGTSGFTSPVASTARTFLTSWTAHVKALATDCEAQADGLRVTIADWLATDEASANLAYSLQLSPFLTEIR